MAADPDRELVRDFVERLYARWAELQNGRGKINYSEFSRKAGISYGGLSTWRAGADAKKAHTPSALDLMRMLRVAGMLGPEFELPAVVSEREPLADASTGRRLAEEGQSRSRRAARPQPPGETEETA